MDDPHSFIDKFKALLKTLPADSFAEWQYASRQVTVAMAVEILQRFPEAAIGPPPRIAESAEAKSVGVVVPLPDKSGGPGGWPSIVCKLGCIITELHSG